MRCYSCGMSRVIFPAFMCTYFYKRTLWAWPNSPFGVALWDFRHQCQAYPKRYNWLVAWGHCRVLQRWESLPPKRQIPLRAVLLCCSRHLGSHKMQNGTVPLVEVSLCIRPATSRVESKDNQCFFWGGLILASKGLLLWQRPGCSLCITSN